MSEAYEMQRRERRYEMLDGKIYYMAPSASPSHGTVAGNIYRIFSFFDKGKLVVLGNGFQKKTMKTPPGEIVKALKIMEEYYNED